MPDLTKEQRAELRKLAEAATRDWSRLEKKLDNGGYEVGGEKVYTMQLGAGDARYVAALVPARTLSLLDTLDRLEADDVAREAEMGRLREVENAAAALEDKFAMQLIRQEGAEAVSVSMYQELRPLLNRLAEAARAASSQNIQPAQEGGK
jgi:hypothetical protein